MAKTVNLNFTVTGKDTTNVTLNSNVTTYLEQILAKTVEDVAIWNPTLDDSLAAFSIVPQMLLSYTGAKIECVCKFVYNSAESTPFVTLVVDGETLEVGNIGAFLFDTSLTLATTSLANPVECQFTFYPQY